MSASTKFLVVVVHREKAVWVILRALYVIYNTHIVDKYTWTSLVEQVWSSIAAWIKNGLVGWGVLLMNCCIKLALRRKTWCWIWTASGKIQFTSTNKHWRNLKMGTNWICLNTHCVWWLFDSCNMGRKICNFRTRCLESNRASPSFCKLALSAWQYLTIYKN